MFLVIFAVLGPLHLIYASAFHDVLALRELHQAIEGFPPSRQVRGVGVEALQRSRVWLWVLSGLELVLLPVFMRVVGHVLDDEAGGRVPTAVAAWHRVRSQAPAPARHSGGGATVIATGFVVGIVIAGLVQAILMVTADLLPDDAAFAAIGLARSVGHSAGGAFFVVALVYATGSHTATEQRATEQRKVPELY